MGSAAPLPHFYCGASNGPLRSIFYARRAGIGCPLSPWKLNQANAAKMRHFCCYAIDSDIPAGSDNAPTMTVCGINSTSGVVLLHLGYTGAVDTDCIGMFSLIIR
jgi:hypothetical protein